MVLPFFGGISKLLLCSAANSKAGEDAQKSLVMSEAAERMRADDSLAN